MAGTGTGHLREEALLRVEGLTVNFGPVQAVSDVSFDVQRGETLGLVGESGCGKSTTARAVLRLVEPAAGSVRFGGLDLATLDREALRLQRPRLQLIAQDPIGSLNPRRSAFDTVAYGLRFGPDRATNVESRTEAILQVVGLDPATARGRRAHQLSGGQAQRVAIARALVVEPDLLVCDEPVSALDVSVQAQILNLLSEIRRQRNLSMLFISHDLSVVRYACDRVAVMYLGRICEVGDVDKVFSSPAHPYTRVLTASAPSADVSAAEVPGLTGELPSAANPPSGCRFRTRCSQATPTCAAEVPTVRPVGSADDHYVACHHPLVTAAPCSTVCQ